LCSRLGVDAKSLRNISTVPYHYIEGLTKPRYKLGECKKIVEDYKTLKDRKFTFSGVCNVCNCTFSYEKTITCSGRTETYIKEHIDTCSHANRVRCDICKRPPNNLGNTLSEEAKRKIGEATKCWWAGITYQKRAAISKKLSIKKKIFWQNNPDLRAKMSEEWSESISGAMKRSWEFYNTKKEETK
jgi:hypothetical protein